MTAHLPFRLTAGASALLRGVLHAYSASVFPYTVSVGGFAVLATVTAQAGYTVFLLFYAFLLFLGLLVATPFFAAPLRHLPIGSTFSTRRSLWTALGIYLTGIVVTVGGMWVVSLFSETGGGSAAAARLIGFHALFLIPGALIAWPAERSLHSRLSRPAPA